MMRFNENFRLGGHLNPAVTLALSLKRPFPWRKLVVYWTAQYLGALVASGTVFGLYQGICVRNRPK
jgi:glycerol uptake facilitator-like aquaporin